MGVECAEVVVNISHSRLDKVFHYRVPLGWEKPPVGSLVTVPLGKRQVQGWVVGYSSPPPGVEVKELASVLSAEPVFPADLIDLAHWMAEYYFYPLPGILRLMAPPRKPKSLRNTITQRLTWSPSQKILLTREQMAALREIEASLKERKHREFLLHGVTGSGKTEVYLRAARVAVASGLQVLYLVPEIGLTPQVEARFRGAFGELVAVWHSRLARGERYLIWDEVKKGKIKVLIGPRSAVFAPFRHLGLVVVDEEHDPSYKEQEQPYYNARDVARKRALLNDAVLILGSATPSLESYTRARKGGSKLLVLTKRPAGRFLPRVTLIDLRAEQKAGNISLLSSYLREKISERLQREEQVILFLNRRGFAPMVFCAFCGYVIRCKNCSISLVYHRTTRDLRCHYCNFRCDLPEACPWCGSSGGMRLLGAGIQKIEQLLSRLYPEARIQRLDLDAARKKGAFAEILGRFARREIDILLGTQMVTKGHDFPGVTLVGVLNADLSLHLPDFRAAERTYQLLTQVAGRSGRGRIPGEVVIQTYSPDHYSIRAACYHNYSYFYKEEMGRRFYFGYPPLIGLVRVRVSGKKEDEVTRIAESVAKELKELLEGSAVTVLGPAPAPVLKVKGYYRWQLMLKGDISERRAEIRKCLNYYRSKSNVIISVDVDPFGF
ncbi:MAG: Primosomal protein N [Thermoanaerobacterales bacterium 50_218]|nr:MAG: Primosomal protein N [Thermoanaerobacterales bacterium 50_218]HAA89267.1 primosomal protein N' [Peptococcaceae bacterium]